jgi:hypothetical protein
VAHERGRIAEGYVFDAVLLDEDPGDLSALSVGGVFQAGRAVVPHERLAGVAA